MLKNLLIASALLVASLAGAAPAHAAASPATVCPTTGNTNTDCGFLITIAADGTITGAAVPGAKPYDGSDDTLVGVLNNMATAFTGAIHLSSGTDIFGFDGDGICTFVTCSYPNPTGYEGPNNTFANVNPAQTAGDVVFNLAGGIAPGASSYFSLEESPSTITSGGGGLNVGGGGNTGGGNTGGGNNVPEPASIALLGAGLLSLTARRKRN